MEHRRFLVEEIRNSSELELAFVWNRSLSTVEEAVQDGRVPADCVLKDLADFSQKKPDLVAEVCHPDVAKQWCSTVLAEADMYVGSPTAFADEGFTESVRTATVKSGHSVYVSVGALWGAEDIRRMDAKGALRGLTVTMKKHPDSLKLVGPLKERMTTLLENHRGEDGDLVVYEGDVRTLCPLAPNNVNTMACAADYETYALPTAPKPLGNGVILCTVYSVVRLWHPDLEIAAPSLGFSGVKARLVANPALTDRHIVVVDLDGPWDETLGCAFKVHTERSNPAAVGAVTGKQTYNAFFTSLMNAKGKPAGIHLS
ncbi:hypothetical protein FOL47_011209 [Perkinsus chesapeaki]|uniref:Aspartate dehydrogenase domain-containing protein n=1 Tax=Perkinsus chesapeaki TaxID=330153 RepID=A0A7J6MMV5_PERCH|nr:hypothetical protein FOL47_011209 [Perkinsus chesapeaki]